MMTLTTAINALKKAKENKTSFKVETPEDVEFLLNTLSEAKTNKITLESILKLYLIEEIDDDKLVDSVTEVLEKNGFMTVEKQKALVEKKPVAETVESVETTEK